MEQRWMFLIFSSVALFCIEVIEVELAVINSRLTGTSEACKSGEDAQCLHFTKAQYNVIYAVGYWSAAAASLLTGFFVSKVGIWAASCTTAGFLFVGITCLNMGPYCHQYELGAFILMFIGRFLFSAGFFANVVISHEVKSHWFRGRELALAFTIYLTSLRLGGVFSFASLGIILEELGLQKTLWITWILGMGAPIGAIIAGWIYKVHAPSTLRSVISKEVEHISGEFNFANIKRLGRDFWILFFIFFFYFGALFTFMSDGPMFLKEAYGYSEAKASLIIGILPDVALLAPLFGMFIDKFGFRDILACLTTFLLFLAFLIMVFLPSRNLTIFACALVAVSYGLEAASLWSSVAVVTTPDVVGVAMGVATSSQTFATGLTLLVTGFILQDAGRNSESKWQDFLVVMVVFAGFSWIFSLISMYFDKTRSGRRLRRRFSLMPAVIAAGGNEGLGDFTEEFTPLMSPNNAEELSKSPALSRISSSLDVNYKRISKT